MATKKKLLQAAAGQAGGAALNVEDVFSTYLYEGNAAGQGATAQSITNNIDLSGEGGLVWIKNRDSGGTSAWSHYLFDTERGATKYVRTNVTNGETTSNNSLSAFNSDGFTLGETGGTNNNGDSYASWTFRKAPKFFDVVTYTGNGTAGRTISHNLGSAPGFVMIKRTNTTNNWICWHRGMTNTQYIQINATTQALSDGGIFWNSTTPDANNVTLGSDSGVNGSGSTYVAYLFAHNDGDGDFGPDGDADIIKCGSYTGDGGAGTTEVNLGFEPQWILVKASSATENWFVIDNMRGWATHNNTANDAYLSPNATNAESTAGFLDITSTGFKTTLYSNVNVSGRDYIYIAIRRGPMAVPESATDVFAVQSYTGNSSSDRKFTTGFPIDANLTQGLFGASACLGSRLFDGMHLTSSTAVTYDGLTDWIDYDFMDGFEFPTVYGLSNLNGNDYVTYNFRRAPSFFDVVAYTGDGVAGRTVSHNLGVEPEMMWVKQRNAAASWRVYHSAIGNTGGLTLNLTNAAFTLSTIWNNTSPTATDFTLGTYGEVNTSGNTYIAYLFASLDGVSKVGSFTTTGGAVNVDCGFSSGARFVLLKAASGTDAGLYNWELYDTERGIVAGNDSVLFPNSTSAEYTGNDYIDPYSAGFTFNSGEGGRPSGQTIIFYAIA